MRKNQDIGKLLLRFTVGGLMIFHGIHKLIHGHDFIIQQLETAGLPKWMWVGVPIAEVVAPLAIILGIATKLSSLLIAFTMLMSLYLLYGWNLFQFSEVGALKIEANVFFLMGAICIMLLGSGKYSVYKGRTSLLK